MNPVTVDAILDATALHYGTSADAYCGFRSSAGGQDVAALLCRRWTTATLRELSGRFGLSHPDGTSRPSLNWSGSSTSNRRQLLGIGRFAFHCEKAPESRGRKKTLLILVDRH